MTLSSITAWLRQGTTILGIATLIGLAAAVIAKQVTYAEAIPAAVGAVVAIALPQRTDAQAAAKQAATDAVAAVAAKGTGTSAFTLGADLVTLAGMLPDNTPVVAVQHTVTPISPASVPQPVPATPVPAPSTQPAALAA